MHVPQPGDQIFSFGINNAVMLAGLYQRELRDRNYYAIDRSDRDVRMDSAVARVHHVHIGDHQRLRRLRA